MKITRSQKPLAGIPRRAIGAILAFLLLIGSFSLSAFAAEAPQKNETPVIFVAGFVSTDTVDTETGETLFPPTESSEKSGLSAFCEGK